MKNRLVPEKEMPVKTVFLSSVLIAGFATTAVAAPPAGMFRAPEAPGRDIVAVAQLELPNSGRVEEVIPAGKYTYIRVTKAGKDTWIAVLKREIAVGAEVSYADAPPMKEFHSPSLNRTFEEILFLGAVQVKGEDAPAMPSGHPAVPSAGGGSASGTAAMPGNHPPVPEEPAELPNLGKVEEVIAAGNYTYLLVSNGTGETWLAIPRRNVAVGAKVRYGQGAMMTDFHSGSLNRTFKEVLFLGSVVVAEK